MKPPFHKKESASIPRNSSPQRRPSTIPPRRIFDFRTYPSAICRSYGAGGVNRGRRGQITYDRRQRTDGPPEADRQRAEDPAEYGGAGTAKSKKTHPADYSSDCLNGLRIFSLAVLPALWNVYPVESVSYSTGARLIPLGSMAREKFLFFTVTF